jgi:hypothetical protein
MRPERGHRATHEPCGPQAILSKPSQFTVFLNLNARFSLPMSSIALNTWNGKDNRLSRHRHHCCLRIRLLAIGPEREQMTVPNARR